MTIIDVDTNPNYILITVEHCGYCSQPLNVHTENEDEQPVITGWNDHKDEAITCTRKSPTVSVDSDFQRVSNQARTHSVDVPTADYSGPESLEEMFRSDRDAEFDTTEQSLQDRVDNYTDRYPNEVTVTLDQYRQGYKVGAFVPESSGSVLIEGHSALVIQLLDLKLTRKYHAKLLNVFTNKAGNLQCGSVVLTPNQNGTVTASCNRCHATISTVYGPVAKTKKLERKYMEQFTYDVIRHGNNHSADFIRNRSDFYKVYSFDSILTGWNDETHEATIEELVELELDKWLNNRLEL